MKLQCSRVKLSHELHRIAFKANNTESNDELHMIDTLLSPIPIIQQQNDIRKRDGGVMKK